jgi:hypothetical protein
MWDLNRSDAQFGPNWFSNVKEILDENDVELLFFGTPYGTDYNKLFGFKTVKPLGEFSDVLSKILEIECDMTDTIKTSIVLLNE